MRNFFQHKILKLPTPKEFGVRNTWDEFMADYDRYEETLKSKYPIRFFFGFTLYNKVFFVLQKKLDDVYWWIRYHTTDRYHMLDLRQPKIRNGKKNSDYYPYGYRDIDNRMLYAMFNLLEQFVKYELPTITVSAVQVEEDESLREQYNKCLEIKEIFNYWIKERNSLEEDYNIALDAWLLSAKKVKDRDSVLFEKVNQAEKIKNDREEEMLLRLIKIRKFLWS